VQYHTLANNPMTRPALSSVEPYDGFAVTCWDSLEVAQDEIGKGSDFMAVLEDQKLFIDHTRLVTCMMQEHVIVEPEGSSPYVLVECHRHRPDLNRAVFQESWLKVHGGFGRRIHALGLMSGFIQNHTLSDEGDIDMFKTIGIDQKAWDGIGMAYFESIAQFKAMATLPMVTEEAFKAENNFDDHESLVSVLTRRHVMKNIIPTTIYN
jgi:hypothetical protein